MPAFTIEQDYLGEFFDPINYDIENGGERPAYHFYAALAKQAGGSALELACGTGLATLRLAEQGIPITGLDIEPGMLAHARRKSERQGLPVRWVLADARNFSLSEKFHLIYLTGNAFQAFLNNSDQRDLLRSTRAHLAENGVLAFETRNPNWEDLTSDPNETEWFSYTNAQGYHVRITEARAYDHAAQVLAYTLWRRWQEPDGEQERITRIAIRYFFPQELNALLEQSGFRILEQYGDWDKNPLTQASPSIITVCTGA